MTEMSSNTENHHQNQTKRKRNRAIISCHECHRRRVKCDRNQPCQACIRYKIPDQCIFDSIENNKSKKSKKSDQNTQVLNLENLQEQEQQQLQQQLQLQPQPQPQPQPQLQQSISHNYSQLDATTLRKLCTDSQYGWPKVNHLQDIISFYLYQINPIMRFFEQDEVENIFKNRIIYLMECKDDFSFFNLLKPNDATFLSQISVMIFDSLHLCSSGLLCSWYEIDCNNFNVFLREEKIKTLKISVSKLLKESQNLDKISLNQLRTIITFMENRISGPIEGLEALHWLNRSKEIVEICKLHLEPKENEIKDFQLIEKRKRLYIAFCLFNWHVSVHFGNQYRFSDLNSTIKFPKIISDFQLERMNFSRLFSLTNSIEELDQSNWQIIDEMEKEYQEIFENLPLNLKTEFQLKCNFQQKKFQFNQEEILNSINNYIAKHYFILSLLIIKSFIHRRRFFSKQGIPNDRILFSRNICIETAKKLIWVQENFRSNCPSEIWLRTIFFIYFIVEPSLFMILAALTVIGDAESQQRLNHSIKILTKEQKNLNLNSTLTKARNYIEWCKRALNLLNTLPMDTIKHIQAKEFLQRILSKVNDLLDWYETYSRNSKNSNFEIISTTSAAKHIFGSKERVHLPLLGSFVRGVQFPKDNFNNNNEENKSLSIKIKSNGNLLSEEAIALAQGGNSAPTPSFASPSTSMFERNEIESQSSNSNSNSKQQDEILNSIFGLNSILDAPMLAPQKNENNLNVFESTSLENQIDAWLALLQQ